MAEIDWVTCKLALGGDDRNVIYRSKHNPVTTPELEILSAIHGENSVRDVEFLKTTETTAGEEKLRLLSKYSERLVNSVFPGRTPNMGMVFGDRPSPKTNAAPAKKERPGTKTTAAKTFKVDEDVFAPPAD